MCLFSITVSALDECADNKGFQAAHMHEQAVEH